ncbi:MAG: sugar isomerase domain-containing protein [Armatimonadota bacterium]|jgi:uncharacterized phosphosugar-binding protein
MSAEAYLDACEAGLARLRAEQMDNIRAAAALLAETIAEGRTVFAFGASHSFMLPMELCYRTGGLMLINPIYPHGMDLGVRPVPMTSQIERVADYGRVLLEGSPAAEGDALLIASTSGRNAVVIDMALAARERGISTIGVTSVEYSSSVPSRHPSGKRMLELCDIVVDNCAPLGDAAVAVPGVEQKTGPLSSVLGCAVVNAIACETIAELVARGVRPPVYISANMPGGDEHNARLLAENADRIHYM